MFIKNLTKYDGLMLHNRFAFKYFRHDCNAIGDIIIFRGEMAVLNEGMLDQEDALDQAFIWSDDALNILWELPVLGNNAFGAVCYQRLFNTRLAELLSRAKYLDKPVLMDGDDMLIKKASDGALGKASVSITHVKQQAALGHTGININAGSKAPPFAYSTHLSDQQINDFSEEVIQLFYDMNKDIFIATTKILAK